MTVASEEAVLLRHLLQARASWPDPSVGLGQNFLARASPLVETPWWMAAMPDFIYPDARGDRPVDFERSIQFAAVLQRLATRDATVRRLSIEVWHMLNPPSVYRDPELLARVEEEMPVA
jgi:hypothetical protein